MFRFYAAAGSVLSFLGVALGAFGAHGLEGRLTPEYLDVYQTGVHYHFIHAFALFIVALAGDRLTNQRLAARAGKLFIAGIILFSGSLYLLAVTGFSKLGIITPFGGLCFLAGWALLGTAAWRQSK